MTKTYDTYRDSGIAWIGNIPSGWEVAHIKHYCRQIYAGGTPQSNNPEYWDGDIPWIPSGVCHDNIIKNAPKYITKLGLENSSTKLIPQNTCVIAMTGATCGNTGYITFETCMNQSVTAYVAKETKTYSKYIFYLLQAAREYILTKKTGGAQSGINVDDCKNLKVPFIKYTEQQAIALYLDEKCGEIDSLISLQEEMISELQDYKQSVITEAVTKGLDPNVPMKDSGVEWIGMIPKGWNHMKLKYITKISRGLFNHRPRNDERFYGGEHPFIQTGDVARASKYIKSYSQTLSDLGTSVSKQFPKGTLTMTIAANVGDVSILSFDAYFPDSVLGIIPNKDINSTFIYYVLKAMKTELVNAAIVSTQLNLNIERVYNMFATVPPLSEQQAIASYLDEKTSQIDSLIALKQEKITELKDYKKSIIYEYVTGKKKV